MARVESAAASVHGRQALRPLRYAWECGDFEPPAQLVQGLIARGSFVTIIGDSNTGKSTLALGLSLAVARGERWFQRRVHRGSVLYVAGEGAIGAQMRITAAIKHLGIADPRTVSLAILPQAVNLLDVAEADAVTECVRAAADHLADEPALIVVDTLARCLHGDENSGEDMGAVVTACDEIRAATGASVLLVHHCGKDAAKGGRGHSSLRAAVDTEILVEGAEGPRTVTVKKQRDMAVADPFAFELVPVIVGQDPETGDDITACVAEPYTGPAPIAKRAPGGKAQRALLRALIARAEGDLLKIWTHDDLRGIGRDLGQHRNTTRDAILGLANAGFLVATIGGHRLSEVAA